jgi:hypothetical protein
MPKLNLQGIQSVTSALIVNHENRHVGETTLLPYICEAITLPAYDELPYIFELRRNEPLEFTLRSDTPVDVLLCSAADYELWVDSGYDPETALLVHLEAEDVLAHTLRFIAPSDGEYAVVLMNWTECPADVAVEIPDFLAITLR